MMKLSIITTMYSSQPFLKEFHDRISNSVKKITNDYEIIFVDDGSPDNSLQLALEIQMTDKRVKIIELSRNFGHYKAIMTGLAQAKGEFIFLIDVDLEEPPELLEEFFARMSQDNHDVIYGFQEKRKGGWSERFFGTLFYSLQNFISGVKFPKNILTVRLMKKAYVQNLIKYKEQELFLAGLCHIAGFNQVGLPVKKGHKGSTTYNFSKKSLLP